jgi:hypothetical protein
MRFSFVQFRAFSNKWKGSGLTDEDLQAMEKELMEHPDGGPVMQGTSGLRKIRFAPPSLHTGKSGELRVCYALFRHYALIYLVTFFAKKRIGQSFRRRAQPNQRSVTTAGGQFVQR